MDLLDVEHKNCFTTIIIVIAVVHAPLWALNTFLPTLSVNIIIVICYFHKHFFNTNTLR